MNVYLWVILCLIVVIFLTLFSRPQHSNDWRITRIERKVDLILQQLEVEYEDNTLDSVRNLLIRDRKIQAIQVFRKLNPSAGLKEATDAVEAIKRELQRQRVS